MSQSMSHFQSRNETPYNGHAPNFRAERARCLLSISSKATHTLQSLAYSTNRSVQSGTVSYVLARHCTTRLEQKGSNPRLRSQSFPLSKRSVLHTKSVSVKSIRFYVPYRHLFLLRSNNCFTKPCSFAKRWEMNKAGENIRQH